MLASSKVARTTGASDQSAPLVLPVGERDVLLQGAIGAIRPPYELAYLALPQHTSVFDGWVAQYREPLDYGALSMAHRGLVALEAAATQNCGNSRVADGADQLGVDAVARAAVPAQSSGVDATDDGGSAAGAVVRAPAAG